MPLSQVEQVEGMSSEEGNAQLQLWDGFGFLGASPSSSRRAQEDPSHKGRQSWRCHSQAKAPTHLHWGQREGQTAGFDLHRAKLQLEKSSLVGRVWDEALEWAGYRGDDLWAGKSAWMGGKLRRVSNNYQIIK